jgi:hypothetical protein
MSWVEQLNPYSISGNHPEEFRRFITAVGLHYEKSLGWYELQLHKCISILIVIVAEFY